MSANPNTPRPSRRLRHLSRHRNHTDRESPRRRWPPGDGHHDQIVLSKVTRQEAHLCTRLGKDGITSVEVCDTSQTKEGELKMPRATRPEMTPLPEVSQLELVVVQW